MRDGIQLAIIIVLSFSLGWTFSPRLASAYGTGMWESAYRMANALEKIEQHLAHCPNR